MTTNATTTVGHLHRILDATAPFTDTPHGVGPVCCVRLEAGGGVITATATNRAVLAHGRGVAEGDLQPIYLARSQATGLRDALAPFVDGKLQPYVTGDVNSDVTLYVRDHALVAEVGTVRAMAELSEIPDWPDLAAVVARHTPGELSAEPVAFAPRVLADLPRPEGAAFRLRCAGPRSPMRVEVGDWFFALVMPTKLRGEDGQSILPASAPLVPFGLPAVEAVAA